MENEQEITKNITERRYVPKSLIRPPLFRKDDLPGTPFPVKFGEIKLQEDIKSSEGPYKYTSEYQIYYPPKVIQALMNLYKEYNQAFAPLVSANREWSTDYQYCAKTDGTPLNRWIQVDMVGLSDDFLQATQNCSIEEITQMLRGRTFELENNLASYQECIYMFARGDQPSLFGKVFTESLDKVRQQYGKPVALLATTEDKYQAMKASEFGKGQNESLSDSEVKILSGFDRFFGPEEFERYIAENNGQCEYLLYVRSSDPVAKLKNPSIQVENLLLANDNMRKIIKANTLTFNVDNPSWIDMSRVINDTKMYLATLGMAYLVREITDLDSSDFSNFLEKQNILSEELEQLYFRAKPALKSFGCYGQDRGPLASGDFKRELRKNLRQRGPYFIQPEMQIPIATDEKGKEYGYMDRIYLSTDGNSYRFMGGCRYFMPTDTLEYQRGRIHGNTNAVLAEVQEMDCILIRRIL